jgi:hypothetical protein
MLARNVLTAFYGINVKTQDDPYIALVEGTNAEVAEAVTGAPGLVVRLSLTLFPSFVLCVLPRSCQ